MKRILVAGCGIGGLSAALNLARKGFDVTVFEQNAKEDLGHDWHDTMYITSFDFAGFSRPAKDNFTPHRICNYVNPQKDVKVIPNSTPGADIGYIDRKLLINHLIAEAEQSGVKIIFGARVISAVTENDFVKGLSVIINNEEKIFSGDLVIDSCGMDSALRKSLPKAAGIIPSVDPRDTLVVYRAYFENSYGSAKKPEFNMHFFHCRKQGVSWTIDCDGYVDILIGGFGSLTKEDLNKALCDFRTEYPQMGKEPIRGGSVAKIPMRRTLPIIVWNGYAAVGDAAVMIEPLSGSGISLSLRGGKILADTVEKTDGEYSLCALWNYQYAYFRDSGNNQLFSDALKHTLSTISADDMDYLFQKRILTAKELSMSFDSGYKVGELVSKVFWMVARPKLLIKFLQAGKRIVSINSITELMPEKYDKTAVDAWIKKYEGEL